MITQYAEYSVRHPLQSAALWAAGTIAAAALLTSGSATAALSSEPGRALAFGVIELAVLGVLCRSIATLAGVAAVQGVAVLFLRVSDLPFESVPGLVVIAMGTAMALYVAYCFETEFETVRAQKWILDRKAAVSDAVYKARVPLIIATVAALLAETAVLWTSGRTALAIMAGTIVVSAASLTLLPAVLTAPLPAGPPSSGFWIKIAALALSKPALLLALGVLVFVAPLAVIYGVGDSTQLQATAEGSVALHLIAALALVTIFLIGAFKSLKTPAFGLAILAGLVLSAVLAVGRSTASGVNAAVVVFGPIAAVASLFLAHHFFYAKRFARPAAWAIEQTCKEVARPLTLASLCLTAGCLYLAVTASDAAARQAAADAAATLSMLFFASLFAIPAALTRNTFKLGLPTDEELGVLKGDKPVSHIKEGSEGYTDDELTRMPAYDLFTWAGKTVVRPAGKYGTRRLFHLLAPKAGQRVCEIGCGQGVAALSLAMEYPGTEVVGLDLNDFMVQEAARTAARTGVKNAYFVQGDATKLPFPDNTFDIVYTEAVSMFMSPADIYNEAARILKPGGIVAGDEFTWTRRPTYELEKLTCVLACGIPGYFMFFYTLMEWHRHLEKAGFQVITSREYPFCYFTIKGMIDDEGVMPAANIFLTMLGRKAAMKRLFGIMTFFQKYEGWFSYGIFTARKNA